MYNTQAATFKVFCLTKCFEEMLYEYADKDYIKGKQKIIFATCFSEEGAFKQCT